MVIRCHHDQRFEAALARPAPGLESVATGVDRRNGRDRRNNPSTTGCCQAVTGKYRWRHWSDARPRSTAACRSRRPAIPSHPRPATNRQSAPRCRRRFAGRLDFSAAQLRQESDKADRRRRRTRTASPATSAARNSRRRGFGFAALVGVIMVRSPKSCDDGRSLSLLIGKFHSERFETESDSFSPEHFWSPPGGRTFIGRFPRQSMSASVANSVRREAQAVIAAISTACAASTR